MSDTEKKREERQPHLAKVKATAFMLRNKETGIKSEAPALLIEDRELKQTIILSKGDALELLARLGKIMKKMV